MPDQSNHQLSPAEREALEKAEKARLEQEERLNDARAEQQMLEGALDTDASVRRLEQDRTPAGDERPSVEPPPAPPRR